MVVLTILSRDGRQGDGFLTVQHDCIDCLGQDGRQGHGWDAWAKMADRDIERDMALQSAARHT